MTNKINAIFKLYISCMNIENRKVIHIDHSWPEKITHYKNIEC